MSKDDSEHLKHLLHALRRVGEDRHHALTIANSASMFMISRCEMIEVNPFLAFIFLRHLANRNIESFLEQSMENTCKANKIELTPERKAEMLDIVEAMEKTLLEGLTEKQVTLEEGQGL